MQPRIYLYKVTFEEVPHWYWGIHKEATFNDGYLGSPQKHKRFWDWYTPCLEIKQLFEYSDEGWRQANEVEDWVILPDLNNPLCLNASCSGVVSLEAKRAGGRKVMSIPGNAAAMGRVGGKVSAQRRLERGVLAEYNSKAGKVGGKVTAAQRWQCLVTGHICSAGPLTLWQKHRGIDLTLRVRLS